MYIYIYIYIVIIVIILHTILQVFDTVTSWGVFISMVCNLLVSIIDQTLQMVLASFNTNYLKK